MFRTLITSRRLRVLASAIVAFLALFLLLRAVLYGGFLSLSETTAAATLAKAFYLGVKFDLRWAILLSLPLLLLLIPLRFLPIGWIRTLTTAYLALALIATLLFGIVDIGHIDYLGSRISISILRFFEDWKISAQMLWESYPVLLLGLLLLAALWGFVWLARRILRPLSRPAGQHKKRHIAGAATLASALLLAGIYGKFNTIQLRWSDAFFSGDSRVSVLASHPMEYFASTLKSQHTAHTLDDVKPYYAALADYFNLSPDRVGFKREVAAGDVPAQPPNIILIMLESLGANRLGLYGNPLGATPNLDKLAEESLFFDNFYVPKSGTARTVFGSVFSLPDFSRETTVTRNPAIVNQTSIWSQLKGYSRHYFLGGNASWANIRGMLRHNIDGLKLKEEGAWKAPIQDVWGISDLDLFKETFPDLEKAAQKGPFIAYIQTAGNHRPFTIPEDNDGFEIKALDDDLLKQNSFISVEQYNAVRLLDFNIGRFLEMFRQSSFYGNTIVMLFGDHNDASHDAPFMWPGHDLYNLKQVHVPFFIHAPGILPTSERVKSAASLTDVMPTAVTIAGQPHQTTALGRSLWDPARQQVIPNRALIYNDNWFGAIADNFLLKVENEQARLIDLNDSRHNHDHRSAHPALAASLEQWARGMVVSRGYLLYNNRKEMR